MREIKFKFYPKEPWESIQYSENTPLIFIWDYINDKSNWITAQYTWLKDKNWKEIYEGDITSYENVITFHDNNWNKEVLKTFFTCEVIFENWWFWEKIIKYDIERNNNIYYDEWKITIVNEKIWKTLAFGNSINKIWNIYENPNLLINN